MKKSIFFIPFLVITSFVYGQQIPLCAKYLFEDNISQAPNKHLCLGHLGGSQTNSILHISTNNVYGGYVKYQNGLYFQNFNGEYTMTLNQNRYVGIKTTDPQCELDVRGNVRATGTIRATVLKAETSAGADFVFNPDYKLMPLPEVQSFIQENKHLPDIAPEKEMVENGIDVADMQIKLLQKIEELTLYAIQQQEIIEKLNEKVEKLETQSK